MSTKAEYYQPSGQVDTARTVIAFIGASVLLVFLSFAYNVLISWIPIVYLNLLITAGYGIAISLLTKLVGYIGRVRSKPVLIGICILLFAVAFYTQWNAFLAYVASDFNNDFSTYFLVLTGELTLSEKMDFVRQINQYGTWSIGISSDNAVSGGFLALIWLFELAILLVLPLLTIIGSNIPPFSEEEGEFMDEYEIENHFQPLISGNSATVLLIENPLEYLKSIELSSGYPYSQVSIFSLPTSHDAYISVGQIRMDEKQNEDSVPIIEYLRIPGQAAREIIAHFDSDHDPTGPLLT